MVHLQGNTQLLCKLRGGLSLVSVEVGTGHTCMGSMLLSNNVLSHHGSTGKVYHQHIPGVSFFLN